MYHNKNDPGTAVHLFNYTTGRDEVMYYIPNGALKRIPCFKKQEKVELIAGTGTLILESFGMQEKLLAVCFTEK